MPRLDAPTELSRAITRLLLDEPFLGHLLAGVARRIDDRLSTAGVVVRSGGRVELCVNPAFFVGRITRGPERIAVVKHEILHLLLRHLFRREGRDPMVWNLACDVVVNAHVRPWPLPAGAVTAASFPGIVFPPDPSAPAVYDLLMAEVERADLEALAEGDPSDHDGWGALSDVEREMGEAGLERLVRATRERCRGWGKLPGGLSQELDGWLWARTPEIDWRRVVRGFAGSSRRSVVVDTFKRYSRRFGTLPGHRIRRRSSLLVAVDVSGSVSDADLERFFAEIHGIWKTGADVTVVTCDAEITDVSTYRGKPPATVVGRGGTAFEPVFAWARARWPVRFDGLIYLTDAEGEAPTTRPNCPVLWVVVGSTVPSFFGRVVHLV